MKSRNLFVKSLMKEPSRVCSSDADILLFYLWQSIYTLYFDSSTTITNTGVTACNTMAPCVVLAAICFSFITSINTKLRQVQLFKHWLVKEILVCAEKNPLQVTSDRVSCWSTSTVTPKLCYIMSNTFINLMGNKSASLFIMKEAGRKKRGELITCQTCRWINEWKKASVIEWISHQYIQLLCKSENNLLNNIESYFTYTLNDIF